MNDAAHSPAPPHSTDPSAASAPVTRSRALGIVAASGIAAVSAFLIQILVGRFRSPEFTAEFLVYWSLLFGIFGVISGMQNETTRAVGAARLSGRSGAPALAAAGLLGGGTAVLVLVSSPLWARQVLHEGIAAAVCIVAVSVALYACHATLSGALAGYGRWGFFAGLMGAESLVRLLLALVAFTLLTGLTSLELAVALPVLVWAVLVALSPAVREAAAARTDVPLGTLLRHHAFAIISSASSAALITGFPVLMQFTRSTTDAAVFAGTTFAISLTRSPIMIPLQAFQGVAITAFLKAGGRSLRALLRPMLLLGVLGVLAAVAAALLGPWVFDVLFHGKYEVAPAIFAGLMLAAVAMAMLTLTGTAAIAVSAHRGYSAGWVAASVVALGLLLIPLDLPTRSVLALIGGPLIGLCVHIAAISAASPRQSVTA